MCTVSVKPHCILFIQLEINIGENCVETFRLRKGTVGLELHLYGLWFDLVRKGVLASFATALGHEVWLDVNGQR